MLTQKSKTVRCFCLQTNLTGIILKTADTISFIELRMTQMVLQHKEHVNRIHCIRLCFSTTALK